MDSLWNREFGSSYCFSSLSEVVVLQALVVDLLPLQIVIAVCQLG
jgi:hypothetical protein